MWKKIKGYEMYEVSTEGEVRRINSKKVLKPFYRGSSKQKSRYLGVKLCKDGTEKTFAVHRLVAEAFIPNPLHLPQVNHKDGNKINNSVDNLEFCNNSYNIWHSYNVIHTSKPKISMSVLQYNKNGELIRKFDSINMASKELNIDSSSISSVCKGKRKTAGEQIWRYEEECAGNIEKFADGRNKQVVKISKYGEAIEIYESAIKASKDCNILSSSNIAGCCKKKRGFNYAGGFMWRYVDDYKNEFEPYINKTFVCATISGIFVKEYNGTRELVDEGYDLKKVLDCIEGKTDKSFGFIWGIKGEKEVCREQRRSKPIIQMDMNGNLVKEWDSTKDASQSFGLYPQNFVKSLKLHNFVYKGFKWKFKDNGDE